METLPGPWVGNMTVEFLSGGHHGFFELRQQQAVAGLTVRAGTHRVSLQSAEQPLRQDMGDGFLTRPRRTEHLKQEGFERDQGRKDLLARIA